MAGEDMVVRVGADIAPYRRELAQGPDIARRFARDVQNAAATALAPPRLPAGAYQAQGAAAGRAFAAGMSREVGATDVFGGIQTAAQRAAGAVAAAFTVGAAVQAADAWQGAANRLQLVTGSATAAAAAQQRLFDIAQETRTEFGATAGLFTRLAQNASQLGASQADILAVTRAVNQSFAISGASAGEAASAITQLAQGLQSARLQGDELRSVLENSPRLAQALAAGLGVTVGELRKMGEEGQLTSQRVFGALVGQADQINAEFATLVPTIGGAFTQLTNAAQRFVGETSQATGAGQALSASLAVLAQHLDLVVSAATLVGANVGLRRLVPAVSALQAALVGAAAAGEAEQALAGRAAAAELSRAQAAQRLAAAKVAQTSASVASLRTLQAEVAASYESARAQVIALEAQGLRVRATEGLLRLEQSHLVTTRALTAAEGALATQRAALAGATSTAAAAQGRFALVTGAGAARVGAAATATRIFSGAVALLGGPVIAGATAAIATLYGGYAIYARNVKVAREETDAFVRSLNQGSDLQLASQLAAAQAKLDLAQTARTGPIRQDRGGLKAIDDEIRRQRALVAGLEQVIAARKANADAARGTPKGEIDAEITRLGKLRDAGIATRAEYQQIAARARALRTELTKLNAVPQTDKTQNRRLEIQEQLDALTKKTDAQRAIEAKLRLDTKDANAVFREFREQTEQTLVRLDLAVESGGLRESVAKEMREAQVRLDPVTGLLALRVDRDSVDTALREAQAQVSAINLRLSEGGLTTPQENDLLRDRLKLEQAIAAERKRQANPLKIQPIEVPVIIGDPNARNVREAVLNAIRDPIQQAIRDANLAAADLDIARAIGDPAQIRVAEAALSGVKTQLREAQRAAAAYAATLSPAERAAFFRRQAEGAKEAKDAIDGARKSTASFSDRMQSLVDATRGVLGIADAFGVVDDQVRRVVDGVADTIGAIGRAGAELARLRTTDPNAGIGSLFSTVAGFSSMIGVIGSAAGVIGSLFNRGPSPIEIALKGNSETLDKLRAELNDFRSTFAQLDLVRDASIQIGADPKIIRQIFASALGLDPRKDAVDAVDRAARQLGTSFLQLNALAKQNGIDLLDSKGRIVAGAFDQLAQALELVRQNALALDASFGGVLDRLQVRNDLFNLDDTPVQQFTAQIDALRSVAPSIAKLFAGINVGTAVGRQAASQMIQRLFDQVTASNATALQLLQDTGFETVEEFLRFLSGADDALDALAGESTRAADAVQQMTDSLSNVPQGFKRALDQIRFDVTPVRAITVPTPTATPTLPTGGRLGTPQERDPVVLTTVYQLGERSIVIDAGSRNGADLLDEIDAELGRRARTGPGGVSNPLTGGVSGLIYRLPTMQRV